LQNKEFFWRFKQTHKPNSGFKPRTNFYQIIAEST